MANPTSSATNNVCRTLPSVSDESSEVGMMFSKNSEHPALGLRVCSASLAPAPGSPWRFSPVPGLIRLPTTRPMASAKVDITRK